MVSTRRNTFRLVLTYSTDPSLRRQRIISWLSPLDFWQKQDNVFSDAHPGTGQWFLKSKSFTRWLDGDTENLWCYGAPGSGKTVIASIAVNDLRQRFSENEEVGVAAVYCEWKRQDMLSPANLLASIWSQLVSNQPLTEDVHRLYDNHTKLRTMAKPQEVVSILKREVERFSSVYIIVDALDELAEGEGCASIFIEALSRLAPALLRKVRILATSRAEQSLLPKADVIQITATQDDIKRFVKSKILEGISTSHSLSDRARNDKALAKSLVSAISKQASGL